MLTAKLVGRSREGDTEIQGQAVAIVTEHGDPIALFVTVAPGVTREYSLALDMAQGRNEFTKAVSTYGLVPPKHVRDLDL